MDIPSLTAQLSQPNTSGQASQSHVANSPSFSSIRTNREGNLLQTRTYGWPDYSPQSTSRKQILWATKGHQTHAKHFVLIGKDNKLTQTVMSLLFFWPKLNEVLSYRPSLKCLAYKVMDYLVYIYWMLLWELMSDHIIIKSNAETEEHILSDIFMTK